MANRPIRSVYFTRLALENVRSFSERQELNLIGNEGRPCPMDTDFLETTV